MSTHRRYEVDGYAIVLDADNDGAYVDVVDLQDSIRPGIAIPWKVMVDLCGVVSRWECAAQTRFKEVNGEMRAVTEFS